LLPTPIDLNGNGPDTALTLPRIDRRLIWMGLGILTLLLRWLFSVNPRFVEVVYSRSLYVLFRWIWDYTLGLLPFPLLYPAVLLLLWGIWVYRKKRSKRPPRTLLQRLGATVLDLSAFAGMCIFFFNVLWGFNYQRVPVEVQLGLEMAAWPDRQQLLEEAEISTRELLETYALIPKDSLSGKHDPPLPDLEKRIRMTEAEVLRSLDYPAPGRVRCRRLFPAGTLLQMGATGIYIPFIGEAQIDAALVSVNLPFTYAHEMAHAYGLGDEGSANFIAWLTCERADDPQIRYAGRLDYWFDVMGQLRQEDPEAYDRYRAMLPAGVEADIQSIRAVYERYPGFFPTLSRKLYDTFLKGQGIEEGIRSYSRVVSLVIAWRKRADR
jgi:hypothetical protein